MEVKLFETDNGKFWVQKNDHFFNILEKYNSFVNGDIKILKSLLKEGETLIDVGAHVGLVSLSIIAQRNIKSYCFEPNKSNYDLLLKNIDENSISEKVKAIRGVVHDSNQSFRVDSTKNNSGTFSYHPSKSGEKISIYGLDHFITEEKINNIRLLKIDTEGAEVNVLNTASELLSNYRPIIFCEMNMSQLRKHGHSYLEIERLLEKEGYFFFTNISSRQSISPEPVLKKLNKLFDGGRFYDLLAIHKQDRDIGEFKKAEIIQSKRRNLFYLKYLFHGFFVYLNKLKLRK